MIGHLLGQVFFHRSGGWHCRFAHQLQYLWRGFSDPAELSTGEKAKIHAAQANQVTVFQDVILANSHTINVSTVSAV